MEKNKNKMLSGALILTFSGLIVKMLGFIYKIPLSYLLSDEGMSYFNSAYTVYTFFYIVCTAGVPKAISILISEADGEGKREDVKKIYSTAFIFFLFFGALLSIIFIFSAPILTRLIGNKKTLLTMLSIAPSIMFVCASGVVRGYYNGILNLMPIAVSEFLSGITRLLLGILFAIIGCKLNFDLYVISAMTMLGTTLGSFFSFLYLALCKKTRLPYNKSGQRTNFISLDILKRIIKIAFPLTLASVVACIGGLIDLTVIIRGLLKSGLSELQAGILYGNYTTLAVPLLNLTATVIAPICTVFLPIVSKSKRDPQLISKNLSDVFKAVSFIAIPVSVLFFLSPYRILSLLFEDSGAALATPMLFLLAPGTLFMCYLTLINTVLEGLGKTKIPLFSLLVGMIIKLIVNFLLIKDINFGIIGAPIGTTVSYVISFMISFVYLSCTMKIKVKILIPFMSVLFSSIAATALSQVIVSIFKTPEFINTVLFFAIWVVLYFLLLIIVKFFKFKDIIFWLKYTKK